MPAAKEDSKKQARKTGKDIFSYLTPRPDAIVGDPEELVNVKVWDISEWKTPDQI